LCKKKRRRRRKKKDLEISMDIKASHHLVGYGFFVFICNTIRDDL
jgi:hypothetical protein